VQPPQIDNPPAFRSRVTRIALHPSDNRFLAASNNSIALFDSLSGDRLLTYAPTMFENDRVQDVCFSSDGQKVLFAIDGRIPQRSTDTGAEAHSRIEILDTTSGQHVLRCQSVSEVNREAALFKSLIVTPDGRFAIALGSLYSELEGGSEVNQALSLWCLGDRGRYAGLGMEASRPREWYCGNPVRAVPHSWYTSKGTSDLVHTRCCHYRLIFIRCPCDGSRRPSGASPDCSRR
jgi:hypothetical protein